MENPMTAHKIQITGLLSSLFLVNSLACTEDAAEEKDTASESAPEDSDAPSDTGDTGEPPATYTDSDGDGIPSENGDCDDENPDIYPGAYDIPDDGIDQDCDGTDSSDEEIPDYFTMEDMMIGMVMITEIMADGEQGQWFELYNPTPSPFDLNGLMVYDDEYDMFMVSSTLFIQSGQFLILGSSDAQTAGSGIALDYAYDPIEFNIQPGTDAVNLGYNGEALDGVSFTEGTFLQEDGKSMSLSATYIDEIQLEYPFDFFGYIDNDEGNNWCTGSSTFGSGGFGSPGEINPDCPAAEDADGDGYPAGIDCDDSDDSISPGATETAYDGIDSNCDGASDYDADGDGEDSDQHGGTDCDDGNPFVFTGGVDIPGDGVDGDCDGSDAVNGTENLTIVDLSAGDLVINEIMKNPEHGVDDINGEWFEIYVDTSTPVDLLGLILSDGGDDSYMVSTSLLVSPGDHVLFANSSDASLNGGLSVDHSYQDFQLDNGEDTITLSYLDASGSDSVIDSVTYDNGNFFVSPSGASIGLSQAFQNDSTNDFGMNWCEATSEYGSTGNLGTPGLENDPC
jgi:hypothetical protein